MAEILSNLLKIKHILKLSTDKNLLNNNNKYIYK